MPDAEAPSARQAAGRPEGSFEQVLDAILQEARAAVIAAHQGQLAAHKPGPTPTLSLPDSWATPRAELLVNRLPALPEEAPEATEVAGPLGDGPRGACGEAPLPLGSQDQDEVPASPPLLTLPETLVQPAMSRLSSTNTQRPKDRRLFKSDSVGSRVSYERHDSNSSAIAKADSGQPMRHHPTAEAAPQQPAGGGFSVLTHLTGRPQTKRSMSDVLELDRGKKGGLIRRLWGGIGASSYQAGPVTSETRDMNMEDSSLRSSMASSVGVMRPIQSHTFYTLEPRGSIVRESIVHKDLATGRMSLAEDRRETPHVQIALDHPAAAHNGAVLLAHHGPHQQAPLETHPEGPAVGRHNSNTSMAPGVTILSGVDVEFYRKMGSVDSRIEPPGRGKADRMKTAKLASLMATVAKMKQPYTSENDKSNWRRVLEWRIPATHGNSLVLSDAVMSVVIVLNAAIIGVSVDTEPNWTGWIVVNAIFAGIFLFEMLVKMGAYGIHGYFFDRCKPHVWNISECVLVIFAILEVLFAIIEQAGHSQSRMVFVILRTLRLMRIARILRVARIPMFAELLLMVNGCIGGMRTLLWSQLLLALPLYVAALVFREAFGYAAAVATQDDYGVKGFQTVGLSFFTMFRCLVAGECFTEDGNPIFLLLMKHYGNGLGMVYYFSFAFMSFGLSNVIAAIFVESTVAAAKYNELRQKQRRLTDRRHFADNVLRLVELMWNYHEDNDGRPLKDLPDEELAEIQITPQLFHQCCGTREFQQILGDLDIAYEEQVDLFETLDVDGSGTLDMEELISGIEKMRGDARRSDVVSIGLMLRALAEELRLAHEDIKEHLHYQVECWGAVEAIKVAAQPTHSSSHLSLGASHLNLGAALSPGGTHRASAHDEAGPGLTGVAAGAGANGAPSVPPALHRAATGTLHRAATGTLHHAATGTVGEPPAPVIAADAAGASTSGKPGMEVPRVVVRKDL